MEFIFLSYQFIVSLLLEFFCFEGQNVIDSGYKIEVTEKYDLSVCVLVMCFGNKQKLNLDLVGFMHQCIRDIQLTLKCLSFDWIRVPVYAKICKLMHGFGGTT